MKRNAILQAVRFVRVVSCPTQSVPPPVGLAADKITPVRYILPVAIATALTLVMLSGHAAAYEPPVDEAGPLSVVIEGPEEVTERGKELPIRVVMENSSDRPLTGQLRMAVIDQWRIDPAEPVRFQVAAQGRETLHFTATAGKETYSAHYPIHAYARFETDGRQHTAHPILILETEFPPDTPGKSALPYEPITIAPNSELALWQVDVHRSVVAPHDGQTKTMPVGWLGSEARTRGSTALSNETLGRVSRSCISIHPPWHEGQAGTQWIEFPLTLPEIDRVQLQFATGMTPGGKGDGVTFRVRVAAMDAPQGTLGKVLFERHTAAKKWRKGAADLSEFAGRTVRLQLESHPGPENNTGWDRSLWAEPVLVAGTIPAPPPFPPQGTDSARRLGRITSGENAYSVRVWPGPRGLLDAVVGFSGGGQDLFFQGFQIQIRGKRIDDSRSPLHLEQIETEPNSRGLTVRHRFRDRRSTFDVVGRLWVDTGRLQARFRLDDAPEPKPWQAWYLEDVSIGPWNVGVKRVYAGAGNVVQDPEHFELGFDGHRLSTSFVGMDFEGGGSMLQASDVPPLKLKVDPDRNHCSLHTANDCTLTLIPRQDVWQAVRRWRSTNQLKPAAGVKKAAGRFVFDLWGGRYQESAEKLEQAFRYGLTDAMVVWHNWQRWGYDYRLPNIYPPNPRWGTLKEMQNLVNTCKEAGVIFAPHDNYIDFYPDADGFSHENTIAFNEKGQPIKAWLNEGRDARSYRYRADAVEPFLKSNLAWIQKHLAPTGYFIDVWSSIRPYSYFTSSGKFFPATYTRDQWGELFAWIRGKLGNNAPQISESGHDALVGWLDGAQTNHLRVGNPQPGNRGWCVWNWTCGDAERTPWFDAAHHDRFILHGAGYGSRYSAGLDRRMHGMYSDDYICTEVLTGHPSMVSRPFGPDAVRKYWLTAELMRALALRHIEAVTYVEGDLHRQHVEWSNGGQVWVNRGKTDWTIDNHTLPPYGFLARVPRESGGPVKAGIVRREGTIVEFSMSDEKLYLNGRHHIDHNVPIRMRMKKLERGTGGRLELALSWDLNVALSQPWRPFLHFCNQSGDILFQAGHASGAFPYNKKGRFPARATAEIPEQIEPGEKYLLVYGIYNPETGRRLPLPGPELDARRIRAGTLRIAEHDNLPFKVAWKPCVQGADPFLQRWNVEGKPIDFGPAALAGGCRIIHEGKELIVTPLPSAGGSAFDVRIHWKALPWTLPLPSRLKRMGHDGTTLGTEPVSVSGGVVQLNCRPGEFSYRLGKGHK